MMTLRNRAAAVFSALAFLTGGVVLVSASPASATPVEILVTSSADTAGTCPSATECTLRQALTDIYTGGVNENSDAIITIADGISLIDLTYTLDFNGGAGGAHTLVLNGNGVTLDGNDLYAIFVSVSSGSVEFNDLAFTHGSSSTGGAIVGAGGPVVVNNSTFSNNHATVGGGAIYATNTLEVRNSTFIDNTSAGDGGAISAAGTSELTGVSFTGNSAGGSAGAVFALAATTITNGIFTENSADGTYAGAVLCISQAEITDTMFVDNSASAAGASGGAVASIKLNLSSSRFVNNSAGGAGGAAYIAEDLNVTDGVFVGNTAGASGGALVGDVTEIVSSTFLSNFADLDAGAVYSQSLTIQKSSFDQNTAGQNFGAVFGGSLAVSQSSFTNNSAEGLAGAMASGANLGIVNSTIANNSGITAIYSIGSIDLAYSTVSGNSVSSDPEIPVLGSDDVSMFATVLENDDSDNPLCGDTAVSYGYNFATDTSCGLSSVGDVQGEGIDPMLGTLGEHGGSTLTRVPLTASPLVGSVPNAACNSGILPATSTDQRGFDRPHVAGGPCDIGAVQLTPQVFAVVDGSSITVSITEFTSTATITIQSEPKVLGTIAIDASGSGTGTFDVGCSYEVGTHTITASADGGQTASTTIRFDACTAPRFTG